MKKGWLNRFHKAENVFPYTSLAAFYDRIMDHVDYVYWADYIEDLFKMYGPGIHRVVDGGCGTGSLIRVLKNRGYGIVGFDRSFEMIRMARKKTRSPLWRGDLRALSLAREWEAFLCLYDTVQYLMPEEMVLFFRSVKNSLRKGGLFMFDVVTENHVLKDWVDYLDIERGNDWDLIRRSWYDRKERCLHTEFEVFFFREKNVCREHHIQKIYSLEEFQRIAEMSGFRLVGRFDGYTFNSGDETSDRVHFVLKRGES